MSVLIIDNFDSFTFNLYQYVGELLIAENHRPDVEVVRNNAVTLEQVAEGGYDRIIISPGPGDPGDPTYFGVCADVIREVGQATPVLGVCLGMQGIAHVFGGKVVRAAVPMHGKASRIRHNARGLFAGLAQDLEVMRYHSLIVDPASLPDTLEVIATVPETGEIMGLHHKRHPIAGVQFHPESFASEGGMQLLRNFIVEGKV